MDGSSMAALIKDAAFGTLSYPLATYRLSRLSHVGPIRLPLSHLRCCYFVAVLSCLSVVPT